MKDIWKKWWLWVILVLIIIYICFMIFGMFLIRKSKEIDIDNDVFIGKEGISMSEYEKIETGKTNLLELRKIIGYTDETYEKVVSEVEKPRYEDDIKGNTYVYYKQKYLGENNNRLCDYNY